jgi:hypothetical protein
MRDPLSAAASSMLPHGSASAERHLLDQRLQKMAEFEGAFARQLSLLR